MNRRTQALVSDVDDALDALAEDSTLALEEYVEALEEISSRVDSSLDAARDDLKRRG